MEWLPDDGKDFRIVVDSNVKLPSSTPDYINYWFDISDKSDDAVILRMYKDKELLKEFRYKISDFIEGYDQTRNSIFTIFRKISDAFKREYLNFDTVG